MKRINYFMAIAIAFAIGFTSCSKDSEPTATEKIAKEYKNAELAVTNTGITIPGGAMKIEAIDATNVKVTLTSIINGHASFEMSAEVVESATEYTFEGKKDVDGMTVELKGTVKDGKASADVKIEIVAPEILNSWTYYSQTDSWGNKTFDPLIFDVETYSGYMYYYDTMDSVKVDDGLFIVSMLNQMLPTMFSDLEFAFAKDGYVSIKVQNAMNGTATAVDMPNIARYYYNPTTKMLIFDAPMGDLTSKSDSLPFNGTLQIPFVCKFEDGKLEATVEPQFLNTLTSLIPTGENMDSLLQILDSAIPEDLQALLPWIKNNIKSITGVLTDKKNLKSFTLGGRLMPKE